MKKMIRDWINKSSGWMSERGNEWKIRGQTITKNQLDMQAITQSSESTFGEISQHMTAIQTDTQTIKAKTEDAFVQIATIHTQALNTIENDSVFQKNWNEGLMQSIYKNDDKFYDKMNHLNLH